MLLREVRKSARLGRLTMTMFVPKVKFGYTSLAFIRQLKSNLMSIFLDVVQESSHSFDIALSEQNSLSLAHWAECRCPFSHLFRFPCESDLKRLGHYSVKVKPPLSVVVFFKKMTFGLTSFFFFFFTLAVYIQYWPFYTMSVCQWRWYKCKTDFFFSSLWKTGKPCCCWPQNSLCVWEIFSLISCHIIVFKAKL